VYKGGSRRILFYFTILDEPYNKMHIIVIALLYGNEVQFQSENEGYWQCALDG